MSIEELPVVVSYGAADVPESWELVARGLSPRFRVEIPRRVPGIDPVAQLAAVIDAQEIAPIVVGHSYGGLIARSAAARSVHRVAGLVLVDATSSRAAGSRAARAMLTAMALGLDVASVLADSRIGRLVLDHDLVPLVPEQRAFRRAVDAAHYAAWRDAIRRGIADGTAANELDAVVPAATRAAGLAPSRACVAVVHSNSLTRRLERPHPDATRRVANVTATGDRFHNIHLVHPEAIAAAVRWVASDAERRPFRRDGMRAAA